MDLAYICILPNISSLFSYLSHYLSYLSTNPSYISICIPISSTYLSIHLIYLSNLVCLSYLKGCPSAWTHRLLLAQALCNESFERNQVPGTPVLDAFLRAFLEKLEPEGAMRRKQLISFPTLISLTELRQQEIGWLLMYGFSKSNFQNNVQKQGYGGPWLSFSKLGKLTLTTLATLLEQKKKEKAKER